MPRRLPMPVPVVVLIRMDDISPQSLAYLRVTVGGEVYLEWIVGPVRVEVDHPSDAVGL
jgi:hypothetical protein